MIFLDIEANLVIEGESDSKAECERLEEALREFFRSYNSSNGEVTAHQVRVQNFARNS